MRKEYNEWLFSSFNHRTVNIIIKKVINTNKYKKVINSDKCKK